MFSLSRLRLHLLESPVIMPSGGMYDGFSNE
nr:MAG TPA: hypothetical protein [Caudoviricetes sp.]